MEKKVDQMKLHPTVLFACILLSFAPVQAFARTPVALASNASEIPGIPEIMNFHTDLPGFGTITLEKGPVNPDKIAREDRLVLRRTKDAPPEILFESKGRRLMSIRTISLTNPTVPDLLLTLDPGGSGGFIEFVLIGASGTALLPLWEPDGIKGGSATVRTDDGKTILVIDSIDVTPEKNEAFKVTTTWRWENGAMVEGESVRSALPSTPIDEPASAEPKSGNATPAAPAK